MRFGAEIVVGSEMLESWLDSDGGIALELATGDVVSGRALIGAMGSQYRRLDAAGVDELIGAGVYYGSAPSDVLFHRNGDVFIVGGANSAGQAALHAAEFARSVTLLVRGPSLADSMSQYLVERCEADPRIEIRTNTRVVRARGDAKLEQIVVADMATGEEQELRADALFILIGGEPTSTCAEGWLLPRRAWLPAHRPRRPGGERAVPPLAARARPVLPRVQPARSVLRRRRPPRLSQARCVRGGGGLDGGPARPPVPRRPEGRRQARRCVTG